MDLVTSVQTELKHAQWQANNNKKTLIEPTSRVD